MLVILVDFSTEEVSSALELGASQIFISFSISICVSSTAIGGSRILNIQPIGIIIIRIIITTL